MQISNSQLVAAATAAATSAAPLLTTVSGIKSKSGNNDVVTDQDMAVERAITSVLKQMTPTASIAGEEGENYVGDGPVRWHVDPIDGTSNYASGLPLYCISIGAEVEGKPVAGVVYDPSRNELFATSDDGITVNGKPVVVRNDPADDSNSVILANYPYEGAWYSDEDVDYYRSILRRFRGARRTGSAAISLAWVAAGRGGVASEWRTNPWDHAAGLALVLAAGGSVIGLDASGVVTDDISRIASYAAARPGFDLEQSVVKRVLHERAHSIANGKEPS